MFTKRLLFVATSVLLSAIFATPPAAAQCTCQDCCAMPADFSMWPVTGCPDGYRELRGCCLEGGTPIIVDVDGTGFRLTSAANGVLFDLNADGTREQVALTDASFSNAFLVLDRNGNGIVDNGRELFGNFTPQPPSPNKNGFLALAEFDKAENGGNGDGVIDAKDAIFSQLRLWIDSNHNGVSELDELFSLAALRIKSISLEYRESLRTDEFGNLFRYRAKVQSNSDPARWAYDVFLTTGN